jgi:hypothetical protein
MGIQRSEEGSCEFFLIPGNLKGPQSFSIKMGRWYISGNSTQLYCKNDSNGLSPFALGMNRESGGKSA